MPKWLPQFLLPLVLVFIVLLAGLTVPLGVLAYPVVLLIVCGGLVVWRIRYLKLHPRDPELASKPFWER